MQIGGIDIRVECRAADICLPPELAYQGFAEKNRAMNTGPSDITISLEIDDIPPMKGVKTIFESGSSWSMFLDREDRLIALKPPQFEKPVWMARVGKDYRDITVYCGNELIKKGKGKLKISSPVCYPLDQILVMYFLSLRGGVLMHAAGAEIKGKGLIFPGKSGAGKSTLCNQISGRTNITPLSDDRMIVRREEDGRFVAYGTPWPGEAGIATNKRAQLAGLMFISHGTEDKITRISTKAAMEMLMPITSIPWYDKPVMDKVLDFCESIAIHIPAYKLEFRPEVGVADVIEAFVQGLHDV